MNIVINAIPLLTPLTGVGNCIYHTARALLDADRRNRYWFYYSYFSKKLICPACLDRRPPEVRFNLLYRVKHFLDRNRLARTLARKCADAWHPVATRRLRFDLYYEPNYVPLDVNARKLVTTVHDLSFIHHPEWHPADRLEYFGKYFLKRLRRADVITADSEFTRRELLDLLKVDESRVRTVHPGCDRSVFREHDAEEVTQFRRARDLPDNFLLFVGSIEPRKNIDRLLAAYARLPEQLKREFKLVLAGFPGWGNETTMRLIGEMKDNVRFLGYLDVEELALCYNAAAAFAYPSLYEGFGLPVLEAMACGCPVVASDIDALAETCADAARFVNPLSVDSIAGGLEEALANRKLRRALADNGLNRARRFDWAITARKMLDIFEEVHGT